MSTYFVDGYLDDDYFGVVDTTGYYLDDYIAVGYISDGVVHEAEAALVVSSTANASPGIVKSSGANLNGVFTPNILAVASRNGSIDMAAQTGFAANNQRTRPSDVTLDNIVNLSLQSARIRDTAMSIAASFAATPIVSRTRATSSSLAISFDSTATPTRIKQFNATLNGVFSPSITATASLNGSIDLHATATAGANVGTIKQFNASLNTAFTSVIQGGFENETSAALSVSTSLTARAIQYVTRTEYPNDRPATLELGRHVGGSTLWTTSSDQINYSSDSYEGSSSIILPDNRSIRSTRDAASNTNIPAGEDFIFEFSIKESGTQYPRNNFVTASIAAPGRQIGWDDNLQVQTGFSLTSGIIFYYDGLGKMRVAVHNENDTGSSGYYALVANGYNSTSWTTYALTRESGVLKLYRNGSLVSSRTNANTRIIISDPFYTADDYAYLNSYRGATLFDKWNFRIGESSLSTPSTSSYDADNNFFHYRFESNILDTVDPLTLDASAQLTSTASVAVTLGGTFGAEADLTTTATITALVDKIIETSATLATTFSATATADKILSADSTLASEFTTTADATRIQPGATSLATAFTTTADANTITDTTAAVDSAYALLGTSLRIKQIDASLNAFVSTLAAAAKVGDFFVDVDLQTTMSATANLTANTIADVVNTTTLDSTALRIKQLDSSVSATSQLTVAISVDRTSSADLTATVNLDTTATVTRTTSADFDTTANLTATAGTFKGSTTLLALSTSNLEVLVLRARSTSSDIQANAALDVEGIKAVEGGASLGGVFAPSITAAVSRAGDIDLTVESTQTATAAKTTSTNAAASAQATLTASGSVTKQASATPTSDANITANAGILTSTSASLGCAFNQTTIGTIIDTTRYVYVVPKESRKYQIHSESRKFTVDNENRTYILGEL